jgi:hypothetical protein
MSPNIVCAEPVVEPRLAYASLWAPRACRALAARPQRASGHHALVP